MAAYQSPQDEGYSEAPLTSQPSISSSGNPSFDVSSLAMDLSTIERYRILRRLIDSLPPPRGEEEIEEQYLMLEQLLAAAPTSMVHRLEEFKIHPRLYMDFQSKLPAEICLKILGHLEPKDLVNAALTSRLWLTMAMDGELWKQLYFREGWRIRPDLQPRGAPSLRSRPSSDREHVHSDKRRATSKQISMASSSNEDTEMPDVDTESILDSSMIATPASLLRLDGNMRGSQSPRSRSTNLGRSHRRLNSDSNAMELSHEEKDPRAGRFDQPKSNTSFTSDLFLPGREMNSQALNWQFIYTQRRRLEANWEAARFKNFQLPHPDFLDQAHEQCIYTIQQSGNFVVSGSRDRTIRIWNLAKGRLVRAPLRGHKGSVLCLQFDASPSEDVIISGSSDSTVNIWRFSTGELIQTLTDAHQESVLNVKFDHRILVTCSKDKTIKIFTRRNLRPGELGYPGLRPVVNQVPTILNNNGFYASPYADLPVLPPYSQIGVLEGHGAAVNAVQIYRNEVASASGDRHIKIWNWPAQTCTRTVVGHTKGIACVQYDGRRIVSGSSDNEVKVFDARTGLEVASLHAHTNLVRTVQAGFGDLPHSAEEDLHEARAVDDEFFRAVDSGTVPRTLHRGQPRNAGSRNPRDIMAYGAKLPPGGGGGVYGRIVSGSYDETVIIWRRDKHEGVWKPKHTLRQVDAAQGALLRYQRRTTSTTDESGNIAGSGADMAATVQANADRQLLEQSIAQGSMQLQQILGQYPRLLNNPVLDSLIDAQPEVRRNALRITAAMARGGQGAPVIPVQGANMALPVLPQPSMTLNGHNQPGSFQALPPATQWNQLTASQAVAPPQNFVAPIGHPTVNPLLVQQPQVQPAQQPQQPLPIVPNPQAATIVAPTPAFDPNAPAPRARPPQPPQPLAPEQARVFKLQFDARMILCCSQTNVIVGWDFANGDKKIEKASAFFAPVE